MPITHAAHASPITAADYEATHVGSAPFDYVQVSTPTGVQGETWLRLPPAIDPELGGWSPTHAFILNQRIQPYPTNAHWYKCTQAGTSGGSEPTWPTNGSQITDGTAKWTDQGLIVGTTAIVGSLQVYRRGASFWVPIGIADQVDTDEDASWTWFAADGLPKVMFLMNDGDLTISFFDGPTVVGEISMDENQIGFDHSGPTTAQDSDVFADDNGWNVRTGSQIITWRTGTADPTAGGGLATGDIYLRKNGAATEMWRRTGAGATAWAQVT